MNEEWYCPSCLLGTGNDYGFDVGEEHSIHSFQARARAFKHEYFKLHRPTIPPAVDTETAEDFGDILIGEAQVEKEFWRLVENEYETVEVEYGADVHSITHGRYVRFHNSPVLLLMGCLKCRSDAGDAPHQSVVCESVEPQ